jgi:hypothetical protein
MHPSHDSRLQRFLYCKFILIIKDTVSDSSLMNDYDSDSSAGDDGIYSSTSVLLGFPSKDPTDDAISHLGGLPVCLQFTIYPLRRITDCCTVMDRWKNIAFRGAGKVWSV